jgi:predicted AlkP superfamily phosphohydrolase/phosphomutase
MRFLRMLTNTLLAGALGAAYLTILLLHLNPQLPLASLSVWRWYATLCAFYGVHLAILFYVVMLLRELVSVDLFSPGWISVRLMAWLSAVAAAVAATLMWLNLRGFPAVLTEADSRRFAYGAAGLTLSAVVLLAIAIAHYSFGRRGSRVGAALLAIAITASLALPIAARGRGGAPPAPAGRVAPLGPPARPAPRITMLLLDGASLEYVLPRVAAGRLPNFGRVLDGGASLDLATVRPTQPDAVWAAVATGMYPAKNGIRSAALYFAPGDGHPVDLLPAYCFSYTLVRLGVVADSQGSSDAWRARPLWAILGDAGIATGIARWPLTYPAPPVNGFVISDRFHQMVGSMFEFDGRAAYPAEAIPLAREAFAGPASGADDPAPSRRDEAYSRATRQLAAEHPVQLEAVRYQGLDTVGHQFMKYVEPRALVDVSDAERQAYGGVLDRYYAFIDGEIGAAIERLAPGDLLLVVSGFGMQPVGPVKHAVARLFRAPDVSGTHEMAPDGFLLAYGTPVARGRKPRGAIVDVTPTILYFVGLPIGRDMDGYARADLFTAALTADRPITFIPSHGS